MNPKQTKEPNKLPQPGDRHQWRLLGRNPLPYGIRVLVMARLVYLFNVTTKITKKWTTIIASVLFGTGLLVAVATNDTQRQKILNLFDDGVPTKDQSSIPEGLEPSEDHSLLPSKEGFWKWIRGASD